MKKLIIPELSGFDVKTALNRLGGNQQLYLTILEKFLQQQKDVIEKIELALNQKKYQEAILLVHTLKGLAGNLGRVDLQEVSAKLELSLIENPLTPFGLEHLKIIMSEVIASLNNALPKILPAKELPQTNLIDDHDLLFEVLQRLKIQVHDRKPRLCLTILEELHKLYWPDSSKDYLTKIENLIQKYHLKDAEQLLEQLLVKFNK